MSRLATLLIVLLFASCAMQPPATDSAAPAGVPLAPATIGDALDTLPDNPALRQQTLFVWATQFMQRGNIAAAETLLAQTATESLDTVSTLQQALLLAQIDLVKQQPDRALQRIDEALAKAPQTDTTSPHIARLSLLRADALLLSGDASASLEQRIQINDQLDMEFRHYNEQMIWNALMQMPEAGLAADLQSHSAKKGWFSLAGIVREPLTNIADQSQKIRQWQLDWPEHPAQLRPPAIVSLLLDNRQQALTKVAVLLPLSGNLAAPALAIRDGLLTAYYHNLANGNAPELLFLDTESNADINMLYQQALTLGAQMVLGPLDKQQVDALRQSARFPVPTLTLNYSSDTISPLPVNLFEYGLAPEDQVQQIAQRTFSEGKRQASVLYPDNEWGLRIADAFASNWQALGGELIAQEAYTQEANSAVARLLQTDESQQRRRDIGRYTNQFLQFDERPRQDLDFVFLIGNADQGRQIKPLLNFHFMSQLPVYALSYIYQGSANPTKDRDLNGIRFVDIPWVLNTSTSLHQQAATIWPDQHGNYRSLFAMGLDSYRLIEHLSLLTADSNIRLPGTTGILWLENQRIKRTLNWAVFSRGQAVLLPSVVSSTLPATF